MKTTVIYASETGNAEGVAETAHERLESLGYESRLLNMCDLKMSDLTESDFIFTIVSTWGDGDPPSDAEDFFEEFRKEETLGLSNVRFAVFALGDTAYDAFCQFGIDMENELTRHGAEKALDRVECDFYFEDEYEAWIVEVEKALKSAKPMAGAA